MLELKDFFHLPQLDEILDRLAADESGLVVVAGLDPRSLDPSANAVAHAAAIADSFLPSGRSAIFRILMRQLLTSTRPARAAVVAADRDAVRVPRQLRRQVQLSLVQPPITYADGIASAVRQRPGLLVIDRLCAESAPGALEAAQRGLRVLAQMDTVFQGADVARALVDLGVPRECLAGLRWVVAVQRLPMLCPHCKEPAQATALRSRAPEGTFFQATGCSRCLHTGRHGGVMAFDVFRAPDGPDLFDQPSLLPLGEYVLRLAALGHLPPDDVLHLEKDQLRRTYNLLAASEQALSDANAALERKLAELESANRVLQQRTEALISIENVAQSLIAAVGLGELANQICRHARELCGADRSVLYYLHSGDTQSPRQGPWGLDVTPSDLGLTARVLATSGWDPARVPQQLDSALVLDTGTGTVATPFHDWPPGIPPRHPDVEGAILRAGLRVPLVAQDELVGVMIVHSTQRPEFAPGEVALLQTFANQAALAIQRAGLIEQLRIKIAQLETAQAELVEKERMERELELARQVQQSVLPRTFPRMPGYRFAARNEPARQVGGDFYDVIALDADRFGVVVADVSDKGMPAALYMALTRSLLLAEARRGTSPRAVLTTVNQLLLELGQPSMFVTVFYGVVERETQRLTYARAGHDRPLLLRDGVVQELGGEGTILGLLGQDELNLTEEQIALASGDHLVLYTDGLTDVLSPDDRLFDRGQFIGVLQTHAGLAPEALCTAVFADLLSFQGDAEQYDDMTMLVVAVD